jgi:hypothetical protein
MNVRRQADRYIGHPACGGLVAGALGLIGHRITPTTGRQTRQPRHQGGFAQALHVDHRVVGLTFQYLFESRPLHVCFGREW